MQETQVQSVGQEDPLERRGKKPGKMNCRPTGMGVSPYRVIFLAVSQTFLHIDPI